MKTCHHAQPVPQPTLNTPATKSRKATTVARATASPMPAESDRARLAMLLSSPAAGSSSQAATYSGTANPPVTMAASTNTIRTVLTLKPFQAATPAAIPPTIRPAGSRRSGSPLPRQCSPKGPPCRGSNGP